MNDSYPDPACLIAFDKFKGALTAAKACRIAGEVLHAHWPQASVTLAPLTDGGEGFASVIASALDGELNQASVSGPRFAPVKGRFALVPAKAIPAAAMDRLNLPREAAAGMIAFVEMASASGYECLSENDRDPWQTTTFGTGELMLAAVAAGASAIVLGIGGSATNDCGTGALEALGVAFYDRDLQPVTRINPASFNRVTTVGSTAHLGGKFPPVRIACDVINPLLGDHGATRVFGPQKGLKAEDAAAMDRLIGKMAMRILGLCGRNPAEWERLLQEPGSGAAGGIGFALRHALPDAAFVEGFPLVADLLNLSGRLASTDLLVTGEGRLDASSLGGKGPVGLLRLAPAGRRTFLLCGSVEAETATYLQGEHPGLKIQAISDPHWHLEEALARTASALEAALQEVVSCY